MPDTPPTYDPNTAPPPAPVDHSAQSYGPGLGSAVSFGGFQYDEATLRQLAKDWNDLANDFKADQTQARNIATTRGPGLEYASSGNADQVQASGRALYDTLIAREQYCRAMAARFEAALRRYARAEDTHTTEINQTGGSL